MESVRTIEWLGKSARIIDQTKLPNEEVYIDITTTEEMCEAIKSLRIRGAPAIGIAAAFGLVLGAMEYKHLSLIDFREKIKTIGALIVNTRPTAVNLGWAVNKLLKSSDMEKVDSTQNAIQKMTNLARAILEEDINLCKSIGTNGANFISRDPVSILTHCNAGALATGGQGTALSVVYELSKQGKSVQVFADETRPLLQGARLTAWELHKVNIPVTVLCDNMAATILQQRKVDCIIVGADRIAGNGDTANKIGTLNLAILANHFEIPFYVAAPYSTFDCSIKSGQEIPIENRDPGEVKGYGKETFTAQNSKIFNPAFDITPNELVDAFITDKGIVVKPYNETILQMQLNS